MSSDRTQVFLETVTQLCGDRFEHVSDLPASMTYKSILTGVTFTIELTEARIHSRLFKSQHPSNDIWQDILDASFAQQEIASPQDILYWSNEKLVRSDQLIMHSDQITQIEISSQIFSIENVNHLSNAISDALDFTELLAYSTFENVRREEGNLLIASGKRYERSKLLRKLAIQHHGHNCVICGFSFESFYGDVGKGFIHIHHIERLADKGRRSINPKVDLVPVCPNCHAMLHTKIPPLMPTELQLELRGHIND
jgi:hypothetical protein